MKTVLRLMALVLMLPAGAPAAEAPLTFNDPKPHRYELTARASQIDPRTRPHPEIDFVFEKDGQPADGENASVDTRVPPQGKLVIWLMGYSAPLFERVNSYGLHAIRLKLLKIGAVVLRNTRRIQLRLSSSYPYQRLFGQVIQALGSG